MNEATCSGGRIARSLGPKRLKMSGFFKVVLPLLSVLGQKQKL